MRLVSRNEFVAKMPRKAVKKLKGYEVTLKQKALIFELNGLYIARWGVEGVPREVVFKKEVSDGNPA